MKDDFINKQAAIDILCSKCYVNTPETCSTIQKGDNWCEEVYKLQNLPSVQPEQRWILCSERLPEKREMVIIWIDMPKKPFVQRSIHMAFAWLEPDARTGELHWMDRHFTKIDDDKVIAWRELPKPYQAERKIDER